MKNSIGIGDNNRQINIDDLKISFNTINIEQSIADKLLCTEFYELNDTARHAININKSTFLQLLDHKITIEQSKYDIIKHEPSYQYICKKALTIAMKSTILDETTKIYGPDLVKHKILVELILKRIIALDDQVLKLRIDHAIDALDHITNDGIIIISALTLLLRKPQHESWLDLENYFTDLDKKLSISAIDKAVWESNISMLQTPPYKFFDFSNHDDEVFCDVTNLANILKISKSLYNFNELTLRLINHGHGYSRFINHDILTLLQKNIKNSTTLNVICKLIPISKADICLSGAISDQGCLIAESYLYAFHKLKYPT